MTDIVCNLLRTVIQSTPEDLVPVVYLSANRIAPAHEGLELGIGDASIIKALAEACGRTEQQIKIQYKVFCLFQFFHIIVVVVLFKMMIIVKFVVCRIKVTWVWLLKLAVLHSL